MKRLDLKSLKLQAYELIRNELITVTGGYDNCTLCDAGCSVRSAGGCLKKTH